MVVPGLGPIPAFRGAVREVFEGLTEAELADMRERMELALAVPELHAAVPDQFSQAIRQVTELIAERAGRDAHDLAVRTLTGAVFGVMISAELH